MEWLSILHLEEYYHSLSQQGYETIEKVTELQWEDLEEIGIRKLGHQKKITLAIKRVKSVLSRGHSGGEAGWTAALVGYNTGRIPEQRPDAPLLLDPNSPHVIAQRVPAGLAALTRADNLGINIYLNDPLCMTKFIFAE